MRRLFGGSYRILITVSTPKCVWTHRFGGNASRWFALVGVISERRVQKRDQGYLDGFSPLLVGSQGSLSASVGPTSQGDLKFGRDASRVRATPITGTAQHHIAAWWLKSARQFSPTHIQGPHAPPAHSHSLRDRAWPLDVLIGLACKHHGWGIGKLALVNRSESDQELAHRTKSVNPGEVVLSSSPKGARRLVWARGC